MKPRPKSPPPTWQILIRRQLDELGKLKGIFSKKATACYAGIIRIGLEANVGKKEFRECLSKNKVETTRISDFSCILYNPALAVELTKPQSELSYRKALRIAKAQAGGQGDAKNELNNNNQTKTKPELPLEQQLEQLCKRLMEEDDWQKRKTSASTPESSGMAQAHYTVSLECGVFLLEFASQPAGTLALYPPDNRTPSTPVQTIRVTLAPATRERLIEQSWFSGLNWQDLAKELVLRELDELIADVKEADAARAVQIDPHPRQNASSLTDNRSNDSAN
jgi:hypothetical protein